MHKDTLLFLDAELTENRVRDSLCLEIGSRDNFDIRNRCEKLRCKRYMGIDMRPGLNVDVVSRIEDVSFCEEFDIVLCCNALEHIDQWKEAICKMKQCLKKQTGLMYLSVPSSTSNGGRIDGYHGYPNDYWRFSGENLMKAFSEYDLLHYTHTEYTLSTENLLVRKRNEDKSLSSLNEIYPTKVNINA